MLTGGLAKRYAKALLNAASGKGVTDRAAEEIRGIRRFFAEENDLAACLNSPVVAVAVKKGIIAGLLAAKALPLTVDFLCLLVEKKRLALLSVIGEALDELIREKEGIARVNVASALPVNDDGKSYLKQRLEQWLGCRVELSLEHEPALLCGIQIRIGDRFFDGSGLGRLTQIRTALSVC